MDLFNLAHTKIRPIDIHFLMQEAQLVRGVAGTQAHSFNIQYNTDSFLRVLEKSKSTSHMLQGKGVRAFSQVKIESTLYAWAWLFLIPKELLP